jgi:hypothetical protein
MALFGIFLPRCYLTRTKIAISRSVTLVQAFSVSPEAPPLQRRMIVENACAEVIELDTDHTPQLSMTDELAQALQRFATRSSTAKRSATN